MTDTRKKRRRKKGLERYLVLCTIITILGNGIVRKVNAAESKEEQGVCRDVEEKDFDIEIFTPGPEGENFPGEGETGGDISSGPEGTGSEGEMPPAADNSGEESGTSPGIEGTENGTGQNTWESLFSDGSGSEGSSSKIEDTPNQGEGMSYSGYSYSGGAAVSTVSEKVYRQPKFSLESSSLSNRKITAGEETELTVVFSNKSQSEAAYNLKVTAKAEEENLVLAVSSFYFAKISPGKSIHLSTMVLADPGIDAGRTTITYTFEYENVKGETYTSAEDIFLNIYQPVQAVLEGFHLDDMVYSQETVTADFQIRNTGRAPIYNVQADLTGQGLLAVKSVYAGTMEPGTAYDGSLKIYIGDKNMAAPGVSGIYNEETAYGETTGTLTLTYEDAAGTVYTETQEFTTIIQKPEIMELKVEEEKQTNQWWAVSLTAVILLFAVILAEMRRKLRKSRNQMADLLALQEEKRA